MSFSLVDHELDNKTLVGEEGAGSGLALALDSYCNGDCGEATAAIRWNGKVCSVSYGVLCVCNAGCCVCRGGEGGRAGVTS